MMSVFGRTPSGRTSLLRLFSSVIMSAVVIVVMTAGLSGCEWGAIGYNKGYAPEQPIHFSHELHAGQYKIEEKNDNQMIHINRVSILSKIFKKRRQNEYFPNASLFKSKN